tara:strand:+ start:11190 stop:11963 length:774 start_codon:yes stop_codon:yes gene_type:complete
MNNTLIFFVPLYNPKNIFFNQYELIIKYGYSIVFYLNSEIDSDINNQLKTLDKQKCHILGDNTNKGISKSINIAFTQFKRFNYLLFLDQDTLINISEFDQHFRTNLSIYNEIPIVYFYNSDKPPFFITNSGCLFNNNKFDLVIKENYFVEFVDYWIYLKSISLDYIIIKKRSDFIDHKSSQNDLTKVKNFTFKCYSNARIIEIFKNGFQLIYEVIFYMSFSKRTLKFQIIKLLISELLNSFLNYLFCVFFAFKEKDI